MHAIIAFILSLVVAQPVPAQTSRDGFPITQEEKLALSKLPTQLIRATHFYLVRMYAVNKIQNKCQPYEPVTGLQVQAYGSEEGHDFSVTALQTAALANFEANAISAIQRKALEDVDSYIQTLQNELPVPHRKYNAYSPIHWCQYYGRSISEEALRKFRESSEDTEIADFNRFLDIKNSLLTNLIELSKLP